MSELKKGIGKLIIKLNSEVLELIDEKKVEEPTLKGVELLKSVGDIKNALQAVLGDLENKPDLVRKEKTETYVKMIKDNITTASTVLEVKSDNAGKIDTAAIVTAKKDASDTVFEVEQVETETELNSLTKVLSKFAVNTKCDVEKSDVKTEETEVEKELARLGPYQAERYKRMCEEIRSKMQYHKTDLPEKWNLQKDFLDYQALKEFRAEFEATHRKLRNMVNEFDIRKYSDILSDKLIDIVAEHFDDYIGEFRRMDEMKRTEAVLLRKKGLELEEYKREKRRAVPTWPKSLPYSKFRPDIISWNAEHHLSTGSVKFGLLGEMLKTQNRMTVYEQIQTRLGKSRNDADTR